MKLGMAVVAFMFASCAVQAAEHEKKAPSPAQQAQQEKMKACNAEAGAKELKGDERKSFMSDCLGSKSAPGSTAQQNKMKACNAEAGSKALKGDARKKFMSECLKADK